MTFSNFSVAMVINTIAKNTLGGKDFDFCVRSQSMTGGAQGVTKARIHKEALLLG